MFDCDFQLSNIILVLLAFDAILFALRQVFKSFKSSFMGYLFQWFVRKQKISTTCKIINIAEFDCFVEAIM